MIASRVYTEVSTNIEDRNGVSEGYKATVNSDGDIEVSFPQKWIGGWEEVKLLRDFLTNLMKAEGKE